jgi:hypothetical protein
VRVENEIIETFAANALQVSLEIHLCGQKSIAAGLPLRAPALVAPGRVNGSERIPSTDV